MPRQWMGLEKGIEVGWSLRKSLLNDIPSQEVMRILSMPQLLVVTPMWSKYEMGHPLLVILLFFMDLLIWNVCSLSNENIVKVVNNFVC